MKKSLGYLSVTVKFDKDKIQFIELTHVSVAEDLWHDYCFFKKQAQNSTSFTQKRYLRAALLVFIAYLEAVTNRWCTNSMISQGKPDKEIEEYIRGSSLYTKIRFLTKHARVKNPSVNLSLTKPNI